MSRPARRLNERRLDLIAKKYDQGLTAAETAELERLSRAVDAYVAWRFPRAAESANLARIDRQIARLRKRAWTRLAAQIQRLAHPKPRNDDDGDHHDRGSTDLHPDPLR